MERTRNDLGNAKLQVAFYKQMFDDRTAEMDALYDVRRAHPKLPISRLTCLQAFNEELDGMFSDVSLPEDEAWAAMSRDIIEAKKDRNDAERLSMYVIRPLCPCIVSDRSRSQLRHQLAEVKAQKES